MFLLVLVCSLMVQEPANPTPELIERTVGLSGPPIPALKYLLLPSHVDRTPGNAAANYYKAFALKPERPRDPEQARKLQERLEAWDQATPTTLPGKEVAEYLKTWRGSLKGLDDGARQDYCRWQLDLNVGEIGNQLTAIQSMRELSQALILRGKLELAEGRIPDAFTTLQTGLQFGKHIGEGTNMIGLLVGYAITSQFHKLAETVTTAPNAPNLYWALSRYQEQLLDPRPALDGEERQSLSILPTLRALEAGPVSEDEARKAFTETISRLGGIDGLNIPTGLLVLPYLSPSAKPELEARGWTKGDLDRMPNAQAVLLRAILVRREFWQDQVKLFDLPYSVGSVEMRKNRAKRESYTKQHRSDLFLTTFKLLDPALEKTYVAGHRSRRRVAMFRIVEAVRLYAAGYDGKLPATLADVGLPLPLDGSTGKLFEYETIGNGFRLIGPPAEGETVSINTAITMTIRFRK